MEFLRQKSETCPEDWECFLRELGLLLEDDSQWYGATTDNQIHPPKVLACKLSQLSDEEFGTKLSEALNPKLANLPMEVHGYLNGKEYDWLDKATDEYLSRLGADTKVTLQVPQKFEELQLIHNLREQGSLTPALQVEVKKFLAGVDESSGFISDEESRYHGTSIALKTNRFIIVAADGKLTTKNNSRGLNLKADKVHGLDDMCVGICGSWKTLSNTVGVLKRRFRYVKNEKAKRPTVSELADFLI
ncbi:N-terminal acetyltransferase B complex auxiliary subunit NAA25-like isoform X1 [Papaver somniferum]|uniref:N-terminal acetyltransferase B complex auxiliary subunit NAA25-like isoform X1 n=1 Tax=Papaver somniferum TaxID=3469 RepID=UPI000E7052F2|nr:N-terminal acetyltransferase B complex auxiliary subunit NAA25-like isoform X1 [Papaver somniferum]